MFDRRNAQPATYPLPLDRATVAQSLAAHMEFTLTRLPQWMQSSRESVKRAMRDGGAPAPHLRRAHWHTFRVGKGRVETRVRWLHPILVGYGEAGQGE